MSGSTLGAIVGGAVGFFFGGLAGARWGWMIGSTAGAILFPPKGPDGPRLNELNVQVSSYGKGIPRVWGTVRIAGNVIWSTDLKETAHKQGGKGGPTSTTYTYSASFAVQWCEGEVAGVRRKWANGQLKYDISSGNTGPTADGAGWFGRLFNAAATSQAVGFTFYPGSATQTVDPTIQADKGNTPAYRYRAYSVFEDLELEKFWNAPPNVEAEIVQSGTFAPPASVAVGSCSGSTSNESGAGAFDPESGYFFTTASDKVYVNDIYGAGLVTTITLSITAAGEIAYVPFLQRFFTGNASPAILGADAAFISAPGRAVLSYPEISGSAFRWPGGAFYNKYRDVIYCASVNGVADSVHILDLLGVVVGTVAGTTNWVHQIEQLGDSSLAAFRQWDGIVHIVDLWMDASIYNVSASFGSGSSCIAYDKTRDRLIHVSGSSTTCQILNVSDRTTSTTTALGAMEYVVYQPELDVFVGEIGTTMYIINADTLTIRSSRALGFNVRRLFAVPGTGEFVIATCTDNVLRKIYLVERLTPSAVNLSNIITDLSVDVGLAAGDLDLTDISGILCDGFVLADRGAAQAGIEQLLMAYQIDVVESAAKVKYVRRSTRTPVIIDPEEMALHDVGQDAPTRLILTRADEVDLPRSVTIKYMNKDADYQVGAQTATRQTTLSRNDVTHELAVVMTDAHAKAVAEAVLYASWAGRTTAKWSMSLKYAELEPTDLVSIDGNHILISKATRRGNMIECEGVFHSGVVFTTGSAGGAPEPVAQTIPLRSKTAVELMDIPLLRDQDDDAGFYVAACGYPGHQWSGCVLFKSSDGGGTWDEALTLTTAATMGTATTALASFARNVFDRFNSVTVRLLSGTLSSITELAVLNGGNAALLGSEIIQFKTATLNGDGTYTLSGLLRGRKGSATSGHAIGDRFVLLNTTSVRRVDMATAEIGLGRLYKAVSVGDSLAGTTQRAFTNTAIGLECLSPVHLGGGRNAAGDLAIKWVRRTRTGGEWRDYVDAALGEPTESYEVDIYADGTYTTVKRVLTSSTQTVTYTSAQQVTDFGGNQATVYLRVYQLSATVGRGFALQGAI